MTNIDPPDPARPVRPQLASLGFPLLKGCQGCLGIPIQLEEIKETKVLLTSLHEEEMQQETTGFFCLAVVFAAFYDSNPIPSHVLPHEVP